MTDDLKKMIESAEKKRADATRDLIAAEFALRRLVEDAAKGVADTVVLKSYRWYATFKAGFHVKNMKLDVAAANLLHHLIRNDPHFQKLIWNIEGGWM